jgi:putative membrane protein
MSDAPEGGEESVTNYGESVAGRDESLPGTYLRGFAMGTADGVPGVSGGTIALITGIYDRLVAAVSALEPALAVTVVRELTTEPRAAVETLTEADVPFLLTLGAGITTAVAIVVPLLNTALTTVPALTFGGFFGLIAASVVVLRDAVAVGNRRHAGAFLAGGLAAALASGSARAALGTSLPATAVAGALAVSAMLLPGISGSLILVILGQYERMSGVLKRFEAAVFDTLTGSDPAVLVEPGTTVVVFVTGATVGLFTVAHTVRAALARDRTTTMTFLVGLVVGALRAPVVGTTDALREAGRSWTPSVVFAFVVAAAVGAAVVLLLDRAAADVDLT